MDQQFSVKQFEDKPLAHYSYAILSGKKVVLVDPQRDPKIYFDFARRHGAQITGVIETHPHADFASSHLEIHKKTGATISNISVNLLSFDPATFWKIGVESN